MQGATAPQLPPESSAVPLARHPEAFRKIIADRWIRNPRRFASQVALLSAFSPPHLIHGLVQVRRDVKAIQHITFR